jgi:hypothetical protein
VEVDVVTLASEFPNDNPALHRGTVWVCLEPTGPALPERAFIDEIEAAIAAEIERNADMDESVIVVEELEPVEAHLEGVEVPLTNEPVAPPRVSEIVLAGSREELEELIVVRAPDVFDVAMAEPEVFDVAETEPALDRQTTILPPPSADDPFSVLLTTLVDVATANGADDASARLSELLEGGPFVAVATAWRDILRGTSEDFDACGGSTLDEWASELLAALIGAPAMKPALRQELRTRGVAAFGLAA